MDIWTSHSNSDKQTLISAAGVIVGLVLIFGFRNFSNTGSNAMAGFFLGVLLLFIGVSGYLASGKQTVVIDPRAQSITIEDLNRFGAKKRVIPFSSIVEVSIGYLGKRSNYVTWYYLVLKLSSGEEYPLFSPGRFYAGGSDRSTVAGWKQRLEAYLSQQQLIAR
jgi:hypothetical protein